MMFIQSYKTSNYYDNHLREGCRKQFILINKNYKNLYFIFEYQQQNQMNKRDFILPKTIQLPPRTLSPKTSQPIIPSPPLYAYPQKITSKMHSPLNHRNSNYNHSPPNIYQHPVNYGIGSNVRQNNDRINSSFASRSNTSIQKYQQKIYYHPNNQTHSQIINPFHNHQQYLQINGSSSISQKAPQFKFHSPKPNKNGNSRPASPQIKFNYGDRNSYIIQKKQNKSDQNLQIDSNQKIVPDHKSIQIYHQKVNNLSYNSQNGYTKQTSQQQNHKKRSQKQITNHIYLNQDGNIDQQKIENKQANMEDIRKQIKDSVKLGETYEEWKQNKQSIDLQQSQQYNQQNAVIVSRPQQISNSLKDQQNNQHKIQGSFEHLQNHEKKILKPISELKTNQKEIDKNMCNNKMNMAKKQQSSNSFDIREMDIEKVGSQVLDEQFFAKLDEYDSYQFQNNNIPTFKVLQKPQKSQIQHKYENKDKINKNWMNKIGDGGSQQRVQDRQQDRQQNRQQDRQQNRQIIIQQQKIEIKRLKNQISLMKLRENDFHNQVARLKKQNQMQKQIINNLKSPK